MDSNTPQNPLSTSGEQKKKLDEKARIRKMLSTAALSVALISWYTTANGLHQYVFRTIWQAYIVSAALQGALFTLSIRGIKLFLQLKKRDEKGIISAFKTLIKRIAFVCVWFCLLCASSIFSYVYISHDVYSDKLLMEDAHRILQIFCLTENYKLDAAANELLNGTGNYDGLAASMDSYISKLAILENGIDLSESDNDKELQALRSSLLPYSSTLGGTKYFSDCIDTTHLISSLDIIQTGHYTEQNIASVEGHEKNIREAIGHKKSTKEKDREGKIEERKSCQRRLETFSNTNNPTYLGLLDTLEELRKDIDTLDVTISHLDEELSCINNVSTVIDSIKNSMASSLYGDVREIRSVMNTMKLNAEEILSASGSTDDKTRSNFYTNIDRLQSASESIYNTLIENSSTITADDPRLAGYSDFQNNLHKYRIVVETQKLINNEIASLYNSESVAALAPDMYTDVLTDEKEEIPKKMDEHWVEYWQDHLNNLKNSAQQLQDGGLHIEKVNTLVQEIDSNERLYLSDLNDFELAWTLLRGTHPYKVQLRVALCFAFGIDLFSVFMSFLLYFFRSRKQTESPSHSDV